MESPKEYYESHGYYIYRNLIPENLIDNILALYQSDILPSKKPFFRQSSNRWEPNKITEYGYAIDSFRDIHDYPEYPAFSDASKEIFCSPQVRKALSELTGSEEHNLMQSMFFDLNTATPAHQDCYYLDSLPNGHLLAGWFALEDIRPEAGRFYVFPGTHRIEFDLQEDEIISNYYYQKKLNQYLEEHQDELKAPELKKGDVLFWNSRTVHGALKTIDAKYSRKSLTAHYLPSQYGFASQYETVARKVKYATYNGMKFRVVDPIYKEYSIASKLRTDMLDYLWRHPKLMKMYQVGKETLKKIVKKTA